MKDAVLIYLCLRFAVNFNWYFTVKLIFGTVYFFFYTFVFFEVKDGGRVFKNQLNINLCIVI